MEAAHKATHTNIQSTTNDYFGVEMEQDNINDDGLNESFSRVKCTYASNVNSKRKRKRAFLGECVEESTYIMFCIFYFEYSYCKLEFGGLWFINLQEFYYTFNC